MRHVVGDVEVERDQPCVLGPIVLEQLDGPVDDRSVAFALVPGQVRIDISRARAGLARPAVDEVEGAGPHALPLRRFPDGLAAGPPDRIADIDRIVPRPEPPQLRIEEGVGHHAVMLRPAAGEERRVIDQRDRGEGGHQMPRPGAFALQPVEIRRRMGGIQFRRREAVEQHDDHRALGRGRRHQREQQGGNDDQKSLHDIPQKAKRGGD
ncbi:MAG: hypothetical protein WDN08_10180 [Rhizomicrobium sp.]